MAEVTITQADRDAAADYLALIAPTMPNLAKAVSYGSTALSRFFAAHRMAAERAVVEWLRGQHEAVQSFKDYAPRNLAEVAAAIERGEHLTPQ